MLEANLEVLRTLSSIRSGFLDSLMMIITELGSELIVIGVICLLYWCIDKNAAYRIGMIFFVSGILVQGLKVTFHIERPWVLDPSFKPVEAAKPDATGYSFPSGHTQSGTALYGALFAGSKKIRLKAICVALVLLVAFSRIYLGVHTPLDVVVSLAVTVACVVIVGKLSGSLERGNSRDMTVCIALSALSVLLCIYSFILASCGVIESVHINDCFKSGGAGLAFAIGWYLERNKLNFDVRTDKIWKQVVKMALGIAGALILKSGLKLIAPGNLILDFVRYFLTVIWVLYAFPLIFSRFLGKKAE